MEKVKENFILEQYKSAVPSYSAFTVEVGLWESEKYVFQKYLKKNDRILDLGCGTGRTTFPLYNLGFTKISGVDYTPEMIREASRLNDYFKREIVFEVGDARKLSFDDTHFEVVIFSFNGIMSIPGKVERTKALKEIYRILKRRGLFIFTTHDRSKESSYFTFWEEEKRLWNHGEQNPLLYEYGDVITKSKNEIREIYIHIPDKAEVTRWVAENGFRVIETFYRSDLFDEPEMVKIKSGECRFWIVEKI